MHEPVQLSIGVRFKSLNKLDLTALGTLPGRVHCRASACDKELCNRRTDRVDGSGKLEEDQKLVKMYKCKASLVSCGTFRPCRWNTHLLPLIHKDTQHPTSRWIHKTQQRGCGREASGFDLLGEQIATQTEEMGETGSEQAHP